MNDLSLCTLGTSSVVKGKKSWMTDRIRSNNEH